MATREENLKKINDELEKLSDEELDCVAGGTYNETVGDSRFLHDLAGLTDILGSGTPFSEGAKILRQVAVSWDKIGIHIIIGQDHPNTYFKNGEEITRQQAFDYACEKYGKKLEDMKGDYNL